MKASLRSVRIAPQKLGLVATMIRGLTVPKALTSLEHTNKKAARILEDLLRSAVANARHNEKQDPDALVVRSLIINKAQTLHRGVPMARGRIRPMRKFLSHVELVLGIEGVETEKPTKKVEKKASAEAKKAVQKPRSGTKRASGVAAKAKPETTASDSSSSRA